MIKYILNLVILHLITSNLCGQKLTNSDKYKKLIGQKYECLKLDDLFSNHLYQGGFLLERKEDIEIIFTCYKHKSSYILVISKQFDEHRCSIAEIFEIKNVKDGTNLQSSTCQINGEYDGSIIALEKNGKYLSAYKININTLELDPISTKGIDCMVDGL